MSNIIEINNLNVQCNNTHILRDINLSIPKNKIVALLGPSGCGKTTLLKCLNRLTDLYPELDVTGEIKIDGQNIFDSKQDISQIRQKMGLLSQKPFPLPMSIYDNIAFGIKLKGSISKKMLDEKVEKHLREVSLWDEVKNRLNSSPSKLSIGQQQRLCLARGLAVDPEIILADEPTSALDPIASRRIEEQFTTLKQSYTIVLVTHILQQAKNLADYVAFMYLGRIVEQGSPEEIFNNPQTATLKDYLQVGH